jgi:hypothetical protein
MFSWNCLACGFSLRECRHCSEDNWMCNAVVLTPGGSILKGGYDGYGQVGGDYNLGHQIDREFSVYHRACWELVGKPTEYTKTSSYARDQGACLPFHGTAPFPKPTLEWLEKARVWHALEVVLDAWSQLKCDLEMAAADRLFATFDAEGQERLCRAYRTFKDDLRDLREARRETYLNHPDLDAVEEKTPDPTDFVFEGTTFDYGWLGVCVAGYEREHRPS